MRTPKEIDQAVEQLRDAGSGAQAAGDKQAEEAIAGMIYALLWAKGETIPGGFGDMLRDLIHIDTADKN